MTITTMTPRDPMLIVSINGSGSHLSGGIIVLPVPVVVVVVGGGAVGSGCGASGSTTVTITVSFAMFKPWSKTTIVKL